MKDKARQVIEYLTADEIRTASKNKISGHLNEYLGDSGSVIGISLVRELASREFGRKDIALLDCGAASGYFCSRLYEDGFQNLHGLDIDDYVNLDVRTRGVLKEFKIADLNVDGIPWPDESFEIITAWCVLPHLENPHRCIRDLFRTVKKGGFVLISMPNINSLYARKIFFTQGKIIRFTNVNNHISIFTKELIAKTIGKYFELKSTHYFVDPVIYKSRLGSLKKIMCERKWKYQNLAREYFGTNVVYVFRRP